jgi:hypothetical protein
VGEKKEGREWGRRGRDVSGGEEGGRDVNGVRREGREWGRRGRDVSGERREGCE